MKKHWLFRVYNGFKLASYMGVVMNYYTDLQIFDVFSPSVPFAESLHVDGSVKMLSMAGSAAIQGLGCVLQPKIERFFLVLDKVHC